MVVFFTCFLVLLRPILFPTVLSHFCDDFFFSIFFAHSADIDFVKTLSFQPSESINGFLWKIDQVRKAAGWSDDKPQAAFGLLHVAGGNAHWVDASSAVLGSLQLQPRDTLEYRELMRALRVVRRDSTFSVKFNVSEKDSIAAIVASVMLEHRDLVQPQTPISMRSVVRLEGVSGAPFCHVYLFSFAE